MTARRSATVLVLGFLAAPLLGQDGTLDPTFGNGGVVKIDWDRGGTSNDYLVALVGDAPDGALFAVGYGGPPTGDDHWEIAKVGPSGAVTNVRGMNFDLGGTNNDFATAATLGWVGQTPALALLVAGTADNSTYNDLEICAYAVADLAAVTSFASSGCFDYDLGSGNYFNVAGIAPAGDGGFIVGGTLNASGIRHLFALKVTSTGQVDINFGFFGYPQALNFTTADDMAVDLAGGILLVGRSEELGGTFVAAVVKLTAAGNLDTGFGPLNTGWEFLADFDGARSTALDRRSGRFVVGGYADSTVHGLKAEVGEVLGDGNLDSFRSVVWDASYTNFPTGVFVQSDGKPLVAGYFVGNGSHGAVLCAARMFTWQSSFDTGWASTGQGCFSPYVHGYGNGFSTGAATLWGSRLVLGGSADGDGDEDWLILRIGNALVFDDDFETGDTRMWSARQQ